MKISLARVLAWLVVYGALALLPLTLAVAFDRPDPRSFLVELGVMLGLLGLGVLAMQLVISGRHPWFAGAVGQDNMLQFHRQMGIFAWLLVLAHPLTLFIADPNFLAYLNPRADLLRAASLIFVLLATTFLVASSLWRVAMKLQYEWWRAIHGALSVVVVSGGFVHAWLVNNYTADMATKLSVGALVGLSLLLLVDSRFLRPWRLKRAPWQVVETSQEAGDATRLVLEAQNHKGMIFKPGQWAWITLGDTPFSLQQHPFSIDSEANNPRRLEFTAKHAGDFTRSLPDVKAGTKAWLEGPYGVFWFEPSSGRRAVFVAGGIGITPMMSMLRSCRATGCKQSLLLLYANESVDDIIFKEELDSLSKDLALKVVHVIRKPPEDWDGESGLIDADLLNKYLPDDDGKIDYFVCGPPPMMNQVESSLRERGVRLQHLYSERFDLV
ncbi:ferredoxin reductase family protein [Marinimicrobium sp. ABcell2]|uniref:ferredoxin reductase family protein n=1 Tax=Marinimicrobium sp. ABcell2 TaxID=3069751 RepID=UPI0027B65F56|nr:ferredoxin reductase family protein [Marinimicrobium sp. ABcell2]MDQ2076759.1 ferredoxin reductase family protein [Marinimicrobium sp. ABcell2]